ncbi:hypothetical protein O3P69_008393 [Scylla paramamosain]|uniref:Uncharacterized protein n=1 Tax=Scylla paramamosain TaxID=85552 RepID=A0AAW0SJM4_SCYPA
MRGTRKGLANGRGEGRGGAGQRQGPCGQRVVGSRESRAGTAPSYAQVSARYLEFEAVSLGVSWNGEGHPELSLTCLTCMTSNGDAQPSGVTQPPTPSASVLAHTALIPLALRSDKKNGEYIMEQGVHWAGGFKRRGAAGTCWVRHLTLTQVLH